MYCKTQGVEKLSLRACGKLMDFMCLLLYCDCIGFIYVPGLEHKIILKIQKYEYGGVANLYEFADGNNTYLYDPKDHFACGCVI